MLGPGPPYPGPPYPGPPHQPARVHLLPRLWRTQLRAAPHAQGPIPAPPTRGGALHHSLHTLSEPSPPTPGTKRGRRTRGGHPGARPAPSSARILRTFSSHAWRSGGAPHPWHPGGDEPFSARILRTFSSHAWHQEGAPHPGARPAPSAALSSARFLRTFSSHAWRSTACVWMHTPSTASTTTSPPSLSRAAVDTWVAQGGWGGVGWGWGGRCGRPRRPQTAS